ncbi:MAG: hypothetical protein IJF96_01170, partial [Firmicutes bacterium]|nr:hypothetical protein [Bacillota bacterium]
QWIYDSSDYSRSDRLVCKDTFTGVMAFDYMDGLMASKIYKTNFDRQYITIHGVTADGEEPADPLTLFVGDESESITKLKSDNIRQIIKAHFNTDPYMVMSADNDEIISTSKASNSEEFERGIRDFDAAIEQGNVVSDLYVHLNAPIKEAEYEVEMPVCETDVSAEDPKVTVFVDDGKPYEPVMDESDKQKAFITENADSDTPFSGTVEGGATMPLQIYLMPKWGYRFSDYCTVTSDFTVVAEKEVLQNGQLKIKAASNIPHSADRVDEVPASCESSGVKEHYYCDRCQKNFFYMTEMGDSVQVEASDEDLYIPALGHDWGEWEVEKEATSSETGVMIRTCKREDCAEQDSTDIPMSTHKHSCSCVEAKEAADCSKTGNIQYWVCDQGEDPCYKCFSDPEYKNVIKQEETITTGGAHDFGEPRYTETWSGNMLVVTAVRECKIDPSHKEAEIAYAEVDYHAPACTEGGYQHVSVDFKNKVFHYETREEYPALGHEWGEDEEGKVVLEPTCSTTGVRVLTCKRCGETKTVEIPADPNAHILFTEEDESTNSATCTEGGRQTQYEICSLCSEVIKTKRIRTEPLGHKWGEVTYKWAGDDSAVTAARVCQRDGCSESESETAETSKAIYRVGTFGADGMIRYYAQFGSEAFGIQEKIVTIPGITGSRLSPASYTYNGKQRKPSVVLTDSEGRKIAASNYSVAYSDNTKAGTASVKVSLKGDCYNGTKNLTFKIKKASNPLKIEGKTAKVKYRKLKKKNQTLAAAKVIRFTKKLKDKKTYTLVSAKKGSKSFKKYFKVNKTTGKVTIKKNKKMKKGTYKVKVKVKAAGNANYKPSDVKTVTFKVKVK